MKARGEYEAGRGGEAPRFRFLRIYFGKLHRLIAINVIYFFITLPLLAFACLELSMTAAGLYNADGASGYSGFTLFSTVFSLLPREMNYLLLILSAVLFGPVKMGAVYTYYCFTRERHTWFSDFFTEALRNLKQGLFFGFLDVAALGGGFVFLTAAAITATEKTDIALRAAMLLVAGALIFYLCVRRYFYLQAVTAALGVWPIIKNAVLLSFVSPGRNILIGAVTALLWLAALAVDFRISAILIPLFVHSLAGFATVYITAPILQKHLIDPSERMRKK